MRSVQILLPIGRRTPPERDGRATATRRDALKGSMAVLGVGSLSAGGGGVTATDTTASERAGSRRTQEVVSSDASTEGMVASSHQDATAVGVEVLRNGGNAVDAAVAVQFALNVVQPHASGIGGGGFMLVYDAERDDITCLDNRERAPLGAEPDMFLDEDGDEVPFFERHTNGKAVGVPGTLMACDAAVKRFGRRELAELIQPAVELAAGDGRTVTVDEFLAETIEANVDDGTLTKAAKTVFAPDGEPLEEGDELVQPDLADTLATIRDHGIGPFYQGEIAADIAETVQNADRFRDEGGTMTVDDLARYHVKTTPPTFATYEGAEYEITVRTMPSPTSGGYAIGQILGILEPFDLAGYGRRSFDTYHRMIEAFQLAFADRGAYLGDDEFVDIPWQGMLDEEYLDGRRERIDPEVATAATREPGDPFAYQPGEQFVREARGTDRNAATADSLGGSTHPNDGQTDHLTTVDSEGNVVSWTTTIEQLFGSGIMVPGRGFMLNNELTDFDSEPGGPNDVQPEKRPLSSTSPTIVLRDGEPFMTVGSPGGFAIIVTVAQVILNVAEFGLSIEDAVEEPRVYSATGEWVQVEDGVPDDVVAELAAAGHDVSETEPIGNVQALLVTDDEYVGVGDYRRDSSAGSP